MIFVIRDCTPIKELVSRLTVELYEMQGNKRVLHSEYAVALDLQQYIAANDTDNGVSVNINGDGIMQELTRLVGAMQLTASVSHQLKGLEWPVSNGEEEQKDE